MKLWTIFFLISASVNVFAGDINGVWTGLLTNSDPWGKYPCQLTLKITATSTDLSTEQLGGDCINPVNPMFLKFQNINSQLIFEDLGNSTGQIDPSLLQFRSEVRSAIKNLDGGKIGKINSSLTEFKYEYDVRVGWRINIKAEVERLTTPPNSKPAIRLKLSYFVPDTLHTLPYDFYRTVEGQLVQKGKN